MQSCTRNGVSWRCIVDDTGYKVPKARLAELSREETTNVLAHLERENNQMQQRLDRFHTIQKARKHLKGKAQE